MMLSRLNTNRIGYEFIRLLNTSRTTNTQIDLTKIKRDCPIRERDPNELHCSPEEWEKAQPFKNIPGPKPLPILGNTWRFIPGIGEYGMAKKDLNGLFKKFNQEFGDIVRIEKVLGLQDSLQIFDPVDVEKVYKSEGIIPERDILPSMSYFRQNMRQDLFKDAKGLLTSHGEDWYVFRNKVNSIMMQPKMIKQYVHPVDNIAKELMGRIKSICGKNNKISTDFWKELNKWALESIAYLAVNRRLGCLEGDLSENSIPSEMIRIAEEVFTYSAKLDFEPSPWKYISTPTYRKAMKLYSEQTKMSEDLIKQAVKEINKKNHLNDSNNETSEPSVLEKLLKIDEKVAIVMALDMLLAGVDTTSTALLNILYYLSVNKSKQETLKKEIAYHLPRKDSSLTADILNSLPYLKACIKEAARLYPVTPGTMRNLTKDTVLSNYQIPKGTKIMFPHMHISIDEKHFPRPNDFIPERWLRDNEDSDISYKKAHPFCAMHFGFGARSCIGRRFAELELEVAVINFMRHFNMSWEGPPPGRATTSINYLVGPFNFLFECVDERCN